MAGTPRLAVLIDADNTPASIADALFDEIAKYGEASVRRIYGDFSGTGQKKWRDVLARHAINPTQQFAYTKGKNASDITLVIEAMDLLHGGRVDGFCLVSSDSDFTRLASRIREQGLVVYGFGEKKTPPAFVSACSKFIYVEVLVQAAAEIADLAAGAAQPEAPKKRGRAKAKGKDGSGEPAAAPAEPEARGALYPPSKAVPRILKAMRQLKGREGWFRLDEIEARLPSLASDWDVRSYGCEGMESLAAKTGAFRLRTTETGAVEIARREQKKA